MNEYKLTMCSNFSPEFVIALIRTPHLPPRFAQFYVPLEFNKLDMRDYMKRVYGIDVLTVRSFVEQQKVTRERKFGLPGYGPLRRPKSKKKMTIEMTKPFVWPEPPETEEECVLPVPRLPQEGLLCWQLFFFYSWNKKEFFESDKFNQEMQDEYRGSNAMKAPETSRESYERQAKDLLEGKATWRPTWQALGLKYDRSAFKKFAVSKGAAAGSKPAPASAADAAAPPEESPSNEPTSHIDSSSTKS